MPSAIERDLATLLPTKSVLPVQLISLASSLLAQSKAIAPKLKQQEEIAREYACAHIACERLTNKLALDVGQVMPPCAPRVYNKLHRYLDGILTAGKTAPVTTPRSKQSIAIPTQVVKPSPLPIHAAIPSKPLKTTTPTSLKRKRVSTEREDNQVVLPNLLIKLGHHLCRTANVPAAVPHVFAGLERAYAELEIAQEKEEIAPTPHKRARKLTTKAENLLQKSSKIRIEAAKLPLVVVAVAHAAVRKMHTMDSGTTDPDQEREMVLSEALSFVRREGEAYDSLEAESLESLAGQVKDLTNVMQVLPFWLDWYANVPFLDHGEVADEDSMATAMEHEDLLLPAVAKAKQTPLRRKEKHGHGHDEDVVGISGLLPGLGTMFQPAFDWLSDERREDYARWECDIRQQIALVKANA